jgi:hypothetical protein
VPRKRTDYSAANREAAEIVLRAPDRYGDGLVIWAQLTLEHDTKEARDRDPDNRIVEEN